MKVNLRCNSAAYAKVLKPALLSLSANFSMTVNNVICVFNTLLPPGLDRNGLFFNDMCKIDLHHVESPTIVAATITLTAHHSSHLIQLQGPDNFQGTTAPIWFAQKFLLHFFEENAARNNADIEDLKAQILQLSAETITQVCTACSKKFSPRSKPIKCVSCKCFFHLKCTQGSLFYTETELNTP